jgi:uncharacterized protein
MQRPDPSRQVAIAVHDVAPATWDECAVLMRMLDELGGPPCTLLVVPHWHRRSLVEHAKTFIDALARRAARGDELCLHGYVHLDEQAPPRSVRGLIERRLLTRAEGEFAAIDETEAADRIARGVAMFRTLGWPLHGFVPPAWLLSDGARRAIARCGHPFEYVSVRAGIYRLPQWTFEPTANLCYSPDRAWRRAASRVLIRREWKRDAGLLRISLHPQDAREPRVMDHWRALIQRALRERTAVTKREWAATAVPLAA